jgi:hypothetical protein
VLADLTELPGWLEGYTAPHRNRLGGEVASG